MVGPAIASRPAVLKLASLNGVSVTSTRFVASSSMLVPAVIVCVPAPVAVILVATKLGTDNVLVPALYVKPASAPNAPLLLY